MVASPYFKSFCHFFFATGYDNMAQKVKKGQILHNAVNVGNLLLIPGISKLD